MNTRAKVRGAAWAHWHNSVILVVEPLRDHFVLHGTVIKPAPAIWMGVALSGCVVLATGAEFLLRRDELGDSSAGMVASLPVLIRSATAAIGCYLVFQGWPRSSGRGLYCTSCGYRQETHGTIIAQCPECGAPWRWIGRRRIGELTAHRWMILVGIALLLLVGGTWTARRLAPQVVMRLLPDQMLLQQLAAYPDDDLVDHWDELDRRTISTAKLDQLAETLLRKKSRDGYICRRAEALIFDWLTRGPAPIPAARQYFSQVLGATMRAPESVEIGDPIRLRATATFKGDTIVSQNEPRIVVVSALYVGDDTVPSQSWAWPVRALPGDQFRQFDSSFTPKAAGPLDVHQVFWLVIGGNADGEVTMGTTGPVLPKGMQIYSTLAVGASVDVKEAPKKTPQKQASQRSPR